MTPAEFSTLTAEKFALLDVIGHLDFFQQQLEDVHGAHFIASPDARHAVDVALAAAKDSLLAAIRRVGIDAEY